MVFLNGKNTFFIYKICMRVVGIWPLEIYKWRSAIIFWISIFLQIVALTLRLIDSLKHEKHSSYNMEIELTTFLISDVLTQLFFRFYARRMIPLIESTIDDWSSITDPHEREIMDRYNRCGTYIWTFQYLYVIVFYSIMMHTSAPYFEVYKPSDRRIQLSRWVSTEDSTWTKSIRGLFATAVDIFTATSYGVENLIFWSLVMHISSQYKILKSRFRKCLLMWDGIGRRKTFCHLVDRHNQLLDLCAHLESSFMVFVGFRTFTHVVGISLTALQFIAAIKADEYLVFFMFLLDTILIFLVIFLFCYAGDHLTDSCKEIGELLIECKWYDLSKDSMINYSIVIARSRKPKTLSPLKFFRLNLSNFKNILRAVYSGISLMIAVTNDNQK